MLRPDDVAVVIPALNEALRIREVVSGALAFCPHVIVVDDVLTTGASLEEARRIVDVQRCRGFRPSSLLDPRNFLPILTPLVVAHLKRAHDMAICLEIRHFFWSAPHTRPTPILSLADVTCCVLGLLCCIALTV